MKKNSTPSGGGGVAELGEPRELRGAGLRSGLAAGDDPTDPSRVEPGQRTEQRFAGEEPQGVRHFTQLADPASGGGVLNASRASWADDDATLAGLVRALDDLLDPMANLCSGGQPKTMSSKKLDELLDSGGAR